jgi:carbon monoxide dehydrogenase subunit G
MEIEGTYTLQASAEEVWSCLMDQQTISHAVPGLERLTSIDEHTYTFALQIRHAPLRGTYTGRASVIEQNYPSSYCLQVEGESQTGQFEGVCAIQLLAQNANTVLSYKGTLQSGKSGRLLSTTLVKGALKVLLHQFFTDLADHLRGEHASRVYVTTLEEMYEMPYMEEQLGEHLMEVSRQSTPQTLLRRLVRLLGLGQRNPVKEEQWVQRLRQFGFVALLLLLVWVGTRLPRRPIRS